MHVVLVVGKKARHWETQLGRAYEIAISPAVRWHHTEHHGGPAIVTPHNRRYLVCYINAEKKYNETSEKYRELQSKYFSKSEYWVSSLLQHAEYS